MVDLKELLIERLDHKNLNLDVDFLRCTNPTAENLSSPAGGFWSQP